MKQTTVAYSKSTRKNHIDVRGRVDHDANTISTGDGGANMSTQNFAVTYNRKEGVKGEREVAGSLNSSDWRGINRNQDQNAVLTNDVRIRKLTPVECERLQGYPDDWTRWGRKEDGTIYEMSNTQRYKMTGNGVSAPVAKTILEKLLPEGADLQSLFSGCEGTECALGPKFNVVGACEWDKFASDVIRYHNPDRPNYSDATSFIFKKVKPFNLLTFGFPCQPFSAAGLRQGFEDEKGRGNLIYNVFDILEKHRPQYFLAENVKGLLSHNKGETFIEILKGLSQVGYELDFELVNSKHYGLAQNRERVFIFGRLK